MDITTFISNLNSVNNLKDNQFRLLHNSDIFNSKESWEIEGDMDNFGSPARLAGTNYTMIRNASQQGFYALGMSGEEKLVNIISPNKGRETRFLVLGIEDYQNTELTVYNLNGAVVFSEKPYKNSLDFKQFKEDTYYYIFKYVLNGKPGAIQSYVDVKAMD